MLLEILFFLGRATNAILAKGSGVLLIFLCLSLKAGGEGEGATVPVGSSLR